MPIFIGSVEMKRMFAEVDTDEHNVLHDDLLQKEKRPASVPITGWGDYLIRAIEPLKRKGFQINQQMVSHLSPLGWEHINLSGDDVWRNNLKLGSGKFWALRAVDINPYKKQS